MNDTSITLSESQSERLAPGHDADLDCVANWNFTDAFAGAGAIRSTANDMAKFVVAEFDPPDNALGKAIAQTHEPQSTFEGQRKIGLAWMIDSEGECLWHNGQTGGYHSFVAVSPTRRAGVVVLCDTASGLIDKIGSQLIRKQLGLPPSISPPLRKSIALSDEQIKNVVGDYQLGFAVMQIRKTEKGMTAKLVHSRRFRFTSIRTGAAFTNRSLHESLLIWATTERHDH